VEVEVEFRRGPYAGTRSWDTKRFRVVGVLVADADDYHFYITNLSREWFLLKDIATLYRCRWAVELLFRELKLRYSLEEFDTSKEHIIKIQIVEALLTLVVSRAILRELVDHAEERGDQCSFPTERWATSFRSYAQLILMELADFYGSTAEHFRTAVSGSQTTISRANNAVRGGLQRYHCECRSLTEYEWCRPIRCIDRN
jgi:putative transposase